ncbi:MAG: DUF3658 domain-containing protein [Bacillota bacterium]
MIELSFSESLGGALKFAKSMKPGQRLNGSVAVIGGTRKEQREARRRRYYWTGAPLNGSSRDVEALTLALDIGDISDCRMGIQSNLNSRKRLLSDLYGDFPGVPEQIWQTNEHAFARIREAGSTQEPIRIWVSPHSPAELCCMYFVCRLIADSPAPLYVVHAPSEIEKGDCVVSYRSTGEIPPEELGNLAVSDEPVSMTMRRYYAGLWDDLVRENAPLRAIVNGVVMGVPAEFYDFALRANFPEGEFHVARLIGNTLIRMPGVSDRWLFLRMQSMLQSGELIEVAAATDDHPYSAIVKRAPGA